MTSADTPPKPGDGLTVALFATCVNDIMFPNTPAAVVTVLERLGCRVEFPFAQTCCGQMFTNSGYFDEALPTLHTFLEAFEDYDYVVGPSGSCVGSIRDQHPMLAAYAQAKGTLDAETVTRVNALTPRVYDLTEFLVDVLGVTDVGASFPHTVTYHPTCHSLRVTKVGDRPYQLLRQVKGLTLVDLPDATQCCGFGGTFSLKNPDVSSAMAADKADNVESTDAEYLVAGDNSCLLNIGGVLARRRSKVKPIHLAEILALTEEVPS